MNKDILYKLEHCELAIERARAALENLREAIYKDGKETAWFDNGKIIINGIEYPILDFKIEWTANKRKLGEAIPK